MYLKVDLHGSCYFQASSSGISKRQTSLIWESTYFSNRVGLPGGETSVRMVKVSEIFISYLEQTLHSFW